MTIKYTKHLLIRLKIRRITRDLPKKIYREADERFSDTATKNIIAVKKIKKSGLEKEMMIAYNESGGNIKLITVHPLKKGQKEKRILSGRWVKL